MTPTEARQEALLVLRNLASREQWEDFVEAYQAKMKELLLGSRNAAYGNPDEDWAKNAMRTGTPITKLLQDIIDIKLSREEHKHQTDNCVDTSNYALILEFIHARLEAIRSGRG